MAVAAAAQKTVRKTARSCAHKALAHWQQTLDARRQMTHIAHRAQRLLARRKRALLRTAFQSVSAHACARSTEERQRRSIEGFEGRMAAAVAVLQRRSVAADAKRRLARSVCLRVRSE